MLSQIFLLNTIMCTYVWLWENKIMRTVYHSKTMDNFMKTSNRPSAIQRTPPTPTEKLHDQQGSSKGRKSWQFSAWLASSSSVRFSSSTPSCALMFGSGKTRSWGQSTILWPCWLHDLHTQSLVH
jgi:hypothetical protein